MDTELILAIVGIVFAVVALGVLSVVQQARVEREKQEKVKTAEHSTDAALKPFFIARYRGSKARFFRVYPHEDAFLFIDAGPYLIMIDAETVRGTRHWVVQSAKLLAAGLAIGAVVAGAIIFTIGRGNTLADEPKPKVDLKTRDKEKPVFVLVHGKLDDCKEKIAQMEKLAAKYDIQVE